MRIVSAFGRVGQPLEPVPQFNGQPRRPLAVNQSRAKPIAQEVTLEEFLNHEHEYAPNVDKLTFDSPAPVQADKDGKYPVPEPGIKRNREY